MATLAHQQTIEKLDPEISEDDKSLRFVNEWLCAIADYVAGLFFVQVLKLRVLSKKACLQLHADVAYLM